MEYGEYVTLSKMIEDLQDMVEKLCEAVEYQDSMIKDLMEHTNYKFKGKTK